MPARLRLTVLVLAAFLAYTDVRGATKWVEVQSPHFTVISDAGEKQAGAVAWQFEQIREALVRLWPWATVDFGRPVIVYAARDERSMRALVPAFFEGSGAVRPTSVFQSAPDGHYIALRTDISTRGAPDVNPYLSSYWSYVSLVLQSSIEQDLPPWLARGMAEVFSNTIVRDNQVLVGLTIPWHLRELRSRARPTVDLILSADRSSPHLASGERMNLFDATAWSLVHYLMFGNQGKNASIFNGFAEAVRRGEPPNEALAKAYGSVAAIREGLALHIDRSLYMYQRYNTSVAVDAAAFKIRELLPADAAVALARLHAATGRTADARAQLTTAGGAPAAAEVEGLLFESEGKRDEARSAFARASEAGAASYYGEYRFASLSRPQGNVAPPETLARIEKSLRRSVELNPAYAPAQALLADTLLSLNRPADALPVAQRALTLDSRDVYAQLVVSHALWRVGRPAEAMSGARRALSIATTENEKKNAQQMLDFLAKNPNAPAASTRTSSTSKERAVAATDVEGLQACRDGDSAACGRLLTMFEQLCRSGEKKACFLTAGLYSQGFGVSRDEAKAIGILEPLCDEGMPEACTGLGGIFVLREGTANRARGIALLEKGCKGGVPDACDLLKTFK